MRNKVRAAALLAFGAAAALALSACGGGAAPSTDADPNAPVTMQFWHNATTGDGRAYWDQMVTEFTAEHPNVTIEVQAIQNEDMDGRLQTAMNSGDAPDVFMARGGGKLADVVDAGQVMDITDAISDATKSSYGDAIFSAFTIDDRIYGLPTSILPGGIFYSQDLFDQAGITETPTTMAELSQAVDQLKAAGIQPIALGAKDAWPAAHWYYFFVLRQCSQDVIDAAGTDHDFSDPCWLTAAENLQEFSNTQPFNQGFLTTSAQQGAGSSAGLIANHQAAMELMGAWNPGVIGSLTPDEQPLPDLRWFPFPAVEGGAGNPSAMMGSADGYSCSAGAPPACVDFLNFIATKEAQEAYAEAFDTLPANPEAAGVVTEPALEDILVSYENAAYVTLWLDTTLGQNIGNALNAGVVNLLAGQGTPQDIVSSVAAAAARG